MNSDLIKSLTRLRDQFDEGAMRFSGLECVMIERSARCKEYPPGDPPFTDGIGKDDSWVTDVSYCGAETGFDATGRLHYRRDPKGNPILPQTIEDRMRIEGSRREIHLRENKINLRIENQSQRGEAPFRRLAASIGELLSANPALHVNHIAEHTFNLRDDVERWICALFDLAWANVAGSPLRSSRRVWFNGGSSQRSVEDAAVSDLHVLRGISSKKVIAETPDPPDRCYTQLPDVFLASSQAIDILLNGVLESSPVAAEDDYYQALWYNEATKNGLYADLLRIAFHEGRIVGEKRGTRNYYSLASVKKVYSQYRSALEKQVAKDEAGT